MSRAAAHLYDRRTAGSARVETLLEEVLERLDRIEARDKSKGDRPEKYDWYEFGLEICRCERLVFADGGIPSRNHLVQHMRDWSSKKWPDGGPSEAVLRAKIARACEVLNIR